MGLVILQGLLLLGFLPGQAVLGLGGFPQGFLGLAQALALALEDFRRRQTETVLMTELQ